MRIIGSYVSLGGLCRGRPRPPLLRRLLRFEQVQLGTGPAGRRQTLLAAEAFGTREPRKGAMRLQASSPPAVPSTS